MKSAKTPNPETSISFKFLDFLIHIPAAWIVCRELKAIEEARATRHSVTVNSSDAGKMNIFEHDQRNHNRVITELGSTQGF